MAAACVMAPPLAPSSTASYTLAAEAWVSVSPPAHTSWTRARSSFCLRKASTLGVSRYDLCAAAW